jgi:two-component system sensor histidine kinase AlgZ
MSPKQKDNNYNRFFMPDFCEVGPLLMLIIACELLAFMLALAPLSSHSDRWHNLGQISLFIQWLGLSSAALICFGKRFLADVDMAHAAAITYIALILNCIMFSEIAYQIAALTSINPALASTSHVSFILRILAISAIIYAIVLRYFYIQYLWKRQVQIESKLRLSALQARIHPHFLFNTMNTIASLTREDPELAEKAIEDLSDLLRTSLSKNKDKISLADEIDLCRRYLDIEKLRLGDRLQVEWHLAELPMDTKVPSLLIQPLLENAIYHGIEPLNHAGYINVSAENDGDMIIVSIDNPLPEYIGKSHKGHQLAIDNTRQRLNAAFGEQATMKTESGKERYLVELRFPKT